MLNWENAVDWVEKSEVIWGDHMLKSHLEDNEKEKNRVDNKQFFESNVRVDW